jgi:hypothetical protein
MKKNLFLLLSVFLLSCGFPKSKPIKFNRDETDVKSEIQKEGAFKTVEFSSNVYFKGKSTATTNVLAIILKQGTDLPKEINRPDEKLKLFARTKAKIVADALENKNEFDAIEVHFIIETKSGVVTTTTDRNFTFSLHELESENNSSTDTIRKDSLLPNPGE